jgi:hypothetical protein
LPEIYAYAEVRQQKQSQCMNKAFVREPDDTGIAHCPRCQSLGIAVQEATLAAQLKPAALEELASTAWFCPFASCSVAYFDIFERVATVDDLMRPVFPKDPAAPICPCFQFTTDEIDRDLAEGTVERTRALVAKSKCEDARCATASPSGRSCAAEVQRYYMKRRGE